MTLAKLNECKCQKYSTCECKCQKYSTCECKCQKYSTCECKCQKYSTCECKCQKYSTCELASVLKLTLKVLKHRSVFKQDNYSTVGGDGGCRVSVVPPCPTIRVISYSKCQGQEIHIYISTSFQKFSTSRVIESKVYVMIWRSFPVSSPLFYPLAVLSAVGSLRSSASASSPCPVFPGITVCVCSVILYMSGPGHRLIPAFLLPVHSIHELKKKEWMRSQLSTYLRVFVPTLKSVSICSGILCMCGPRPYLIFTSLHHIHSAHGLKRNPTQITNVHKDTNFMQYAISSGWHILKDDCYC